MEMFLSQEWAGLAIAAPLAAAGLLALVRVRGINRRWLRWLGGTPAALVAGIATLLTAGSIFHLAQRVYDRSAYPAPGALFDVGGYRLHLLAEGPAAGPTVVWVGGGYAQGLASYGLHQRLRQHARSVLYDHAGTGWSERGPWPRTIELEVAELKRLLEAAGERGPYLLAGHSFGGLIASNFAARYPGDTAGLVLFDPTPVSSAALSAGLPQVALIGPMMRAVALAHAFGLSPFITTGGGFFVPSSYKETFLQHLEGMGPMREAFEANERRAAANMAAASIIAPFLAGATAGLVHAPGALRDLPVTAVYTDTLDAASWTEEIQAAHRQAVTSEEEWQRRLVLIETANREVEQLSSRARRLAPPAGSTHNFPHEHPDFCVDQVRELLQAVAAKEEPA